MLNIEHLKKQAKLYLRWHREQSYPVAARIRWRRKSVTRSASHPYPMTAQAMSSDMIPLGSIDERL